MNKGLVTYATYAYTSKNAEASQMLRYGDLEIRLRDGKYHFVSKNGAAIDNIQQINFMDSKIRGITDDISKIPEFEREYYALSALAKSINIGNIELNEEYLKNIEDSIEDINRFKDKLEEFLSFMEHFKEVVSPQIEELWEWYNRIGKYLQDFNFCELSHLRDKILKMWKWYLNNKNITTDELATIRSYIDEIEEMIDYLLNNLIKRLMILEKIYKEFYPDEMDELTDKVTEIWKWYDINKSLTLEQVQELKRIFSELSLKFNDLDDRVKALELKFNS